MAKRANLTTDHTNDIDDVRRVRCGMDYGGQSPRPRYAIRAFMVVLRPIVRLRKL